LKIKELSLQTQFLFKKGDKMKIDEVLDCKSKEELFLWLKINSKNKKYAFVELSTKKKQGMISYIDLVYEVIKFGWIDGMRINIDGKSLIRISPRRKNSNWTEQNKARARFLIDNDLMQESGFNVLPDLNLDFKIDDEILTKLKEDQTTFQNFQNFSNLYKTIKIDNIQTVKVNKELYYKRLEKFLISTKENVLYGLWDDQGRLSKK
jgi:hypothetical protein